MRNFTVIIFTLVGSLFLAAPTSANNSGVVNATPITPYEIVRVYPHDKEAFTQGLLFHDGFLYAVSYTHLTLPTILLV